MSKQQQQQKKVKAKMKCQQRCFRRAKRNHAQLTRNRYVFPDRLLKILKGKKTVTVVAAVLSSLMIFDLISMIEINGWIQEKKNRRNLIRTHFT